jgi:citrate synthase
MSKDKNWYTGIATVEPNRIIVRGHRIDDMMGKVSFAQAVYLVLKGELPSPEQGTLIEAILVSSIDHGVTPPSTLAARTVATTGASLTAALAPGILAIGRYHGGAVEECMETLLEVKQRSQQAKQRLEEVALALAREHHEQGRRLAGFGHKVHTQDPRTVRLFALAEELGVAGDFVRAAKALEEALFLVLARRFPINVDGAIAAVLCEMGFPPGLGNAFFIISRVPGLIAHIYEERTRERPLRMINLARCEYDGPPAR